MQTDTIILDSVTVLFALLSETNGKTTLSRQRKAIKALIESAGHSPSSLCYTPEGKPYLSGPKKPCISISHSNSRVAVALSHDPVGIDIERTGRCSQEVMNHITEKKEQELLAALADTCQSDAAAATLPVKDAIAIRVWCAKEAVFKLYGTEARVITQIELTDMSMTEARTASPFAAKVRFIERENYVLAVAVLQSEQ